MISFIVGVIMLLSSYWTTARITYYTLTGVMASGHYTGWGSAACSDRIPLYTKITLPDGYVVTCLDRGLEYEVNKMGADIWIDIWVPSWDHIRYLQSIYGDVVEVEVTP